RERVTGEHLRELQRRLRRDHHRGRWLWFRPGGRVRKRRTHESLWPAGDAGASVPDRGRPRDLRSTGPECLHQAYSSLQRRLSQWLITTRSASCWLTTTPSCERVSRPCST